MWTFGCALGFAAYQQLSRWGWSSRHSSERFERTYNFVMGAAFGTIVVASTMLRRRRRPGDPMDVDALLPGHWLLLFGLAAALVNSIACGLYVLTWRPSLVTSIAPHWLQFKWGRGLNIHELKQQVVGWGLGSVAALLFVKRVRSRLSWPWRVVFFLFFVITAVFAGGSVYYLFYRSSNARSWNWPVAMAWKALAIPLYAGLTGAGMVSILVAVVNDRLRRAPTDRLHWTGLVAWLAIGAVQLGTAWLLM